MTEFNVDLYRQILAAIKENPKHWRQHMWHCGTSHCFAGFGQCILEKIPFNARIDDVIGEKGMPYAYAERILPNPREQVKRALGINNRTANWLFHCKRTIKDFEWALAEYVRTGEFPFSYKDDNGPALR